MKIHMLSGNTEYSSEASLEKLAAFFRRQWNWQCTISRGVDRGTDLPELDKLDDADVLVVFCKRMTLPADQLGKIQAWCRVGKPVVGIRTASHAFQNWLEFDKEILGGSYNNHGGDELVKHAIAAPDHAITRGLTTWSSPGKVYYNNTLADDATVLISAADCKEAGQPLAWCRTVPATGGRVFYTSVGHTHDFDNDCYLRMLSNAIRWTSKVSTEARFTVAHLADIPAVACPCGQSRRAFTTDPDRVASIHMVDITIDAKTHYHKKLTEIYLILEGEGHMELDGELIPVKPMTTILIKPGCRHRAVGKMRIVNMPIPAFDPTDEWFD